jgi:hypothetical protein
MLHITNGDSVAFTLPGAEIPGEVAVWAEALHEGPIAVDTGTDEWRRARARFYADAFGIETFEENLARLEAWDAALDRASEHEEVVLWLEHDLFDQLLLIRHLDWFGRNHPGLRVSLICIDRHDAVGRFLGLGQLAAAHLVPLLGLRQTVTEAQVRLGSAAWHAFGAESPEGLVALLEGDTSALPFLQAALRRHLEQFPAVGDGLARTERFALESLRDGPRLAADLFLDQQKAEEAPFLGDLTFWSYLERLASGPAPLIRFRDEGRPWGARTASLTDAGREVLDGGADWLALHPSNERWLGGVLVRGPETPWRRDAASGRLVASAGG